MKWCGRYFCWCDELVEIIPEEGIDCDLECDDCEVCEDVAAQRY